MTALALRIARALIPYAVFVGGIWFAWQQMQQLDESVAGHFTYSAVKPTAEIDI